MNHSRRILSSPALACALFGVLGVACGADDVPPTPSAPSDPPVAVEPPPPPAPPALAPLPTPAPGSAGVLARAFDALAEAPFCEAEVCVDPFPFHAIEHVDVAGERIALSGLGGWVALYQEGAWTFLRAPDRVFVHDAAFAPDGTLYAVGDPNVLMALEGDALVVRGRMRRGGLRAVLTAVLPLGRDDIWVGSMYGRLAHWDGTRFVEAPTRGAPRTTVSAISRLPNGEMVASGDLATSVLVEGAWRDATTRAQWVETGVANGCWTESSVDDVIADPDIAPRGPRYEGIPPNVPDRSVRALAVGLDEARAGLLRALVDDPPEAIELEGTSDGQDWIRVVRLSSRALAVWARIDGRLHVLAPPPPSLSAVSIGEHVASLVTGEGVLYRIPALGFLDPTARTEVRVGTHAPVRDVLSTDAHESWVVAADGEIHRVRDTESTLMHASRRVLHAIAGDRSEAFAVGEDGAVVHYDGSTWTTLPRATRADLHRVIRVGPGSAIAVGDAGTVLRFEGGALAPADGLLPRPIHDRFEDAWLEGEALFVRTSRELFRWDGRWQMLEPTVPAYYSSSFGASSSLARFAPRESWRIDRSPAGAWLDPDPLTDVPIAFDPPAGSAPTSMWERYPISPWRSRVSHPAWALALPDRRREIIHYETEFCCDPEGDDSEIMGGDRPQQCAAPDASCSPVPPHPALGYDTRRRELLRTVPLTPPLASRFDPPFRVPLPGPCVPTRIEIVAIETGLVTSGATLSCTDTHDGWRALADLSRFASFRLIPFEEGAGRLAVHRAPDADTLVTVSQDLVTTTVMARLPRGDAAPSEVEAWGEVVERYVSPDLRYTRFVAAFATGDVEWIIPMPSELRRVAADACDRVYVTDPDGSTHVRAEPSSRAEIVGELANYDFASVVERHGAWIQIASPAGWVYSENVHCQ